MSPPRTSATSLSHDRDFEAVRSWLIPPARLAAAGRAIRLAIDWVLDGARTRRYAIDQLKTSEKVYIGNRVEHEILFQWGLEKSRDKLDTVIEGIPVDIKFSIATGWMIPPEAIDQICVMVTADDDDSTYSLGLLRASRKFLKKENSAAKGNRDAKWNILKAGKDAIEWVARNAALPENFLLHLPEQIRTKVVLRQSGQARVTEMFRLVLNKPIPTAAIDTLAVQRDSSKRIRDARRVLKREGIAVLGWRYDRKKLEELGWALPQDHWVSLRVGNSAEDLESRR